MLVLEFLTGSLSGSRTILTNPAVRIGRAADCDVRFDEQLGREVSAHHAQLVQDGEDWVVIDTSSTNGTWVNGERVSKRRLETGDVLLLGGEQGVRARVEVRRNQATPSAGRPSAKTEPGTPLPLPGDLGPLFDQVKTKPDTQLVRAAEVTTQKVAAERARVGGKRSGKTLGFIAVAMAEIQATTQSRWRKIVALVAAAGVVAAAVLGGVILVQRREIDRLVLQKRGIDQQIAAVQAAMMTEVDPDRLSALEGQLVDLTGSATDTLGELARRDQKKAQELEQSGDDLDRAIRRILEKFDAHTYAVPPVFREALEAEIGALTRAGNLRVVYARRNRYWPVIQKEFSALGMPEEMAYIAWVETQFDPDAMSSAGARGMWQMTASTARELGLVVDDRLDERLDVPKQTRAAARKLANLLAEFGADSFMLAMASYNRGEAGVRRALHQVAQEKDGFRREKRDFWHLYRLKRLPAETMDYVPRVLAAAVVCNDPARYGLPQP